MLSVWWQPFPIATIWNFQTQLDSWGGLWAVASRVGIWIGAFEYIQSALETQGVHPYFSGCTMLLSNCLGLCSALHLGSDWGAVSHFHRRSVQCREVHLLTFLIGLLPEAAALHVDRSSRALGRIPLNVQ